MKSLIVTCLLTQETHSMIPKMYFWLFQNIMKLYVNLFSQIFDVYMISLRSSNCWRLDPVVKDYNDFDVQAVPLQPNGYNLYVLLTF